MAPVSIVLNPEFLAKSYYPSELLKSLELKLLVVGQKKLHPKSVQKIERLLKPFRLSCSLEVLEAQYVHGVKVSQAGVNRAKEQMI